MWDDDDEPDDRPCDDSDDELGPLATFVVATVIGGLILHALCRPRAPGAAP